jgi:hypothetical protein
LASNTRYFYRVQSRPSGTGAFSATPEYNFHTQRAQGSAFSFTIEADEHLYDKKGVQSIYQICLNNQAQNRPDFMLSLGDIFGDDHIASTISQFQADSLHKAYRPFLGSICHSIPFYVCLGNHEGENDYYLAQTPPNNIAVYSTLARKYFFPNPFPNSFYSGNTDVEPFGMDNPENYFSWTWGDALFVVLDVYRDECDTSPKPKGWNWSLGQPQYNWLENTLQSSTAQYKFVFAHHVSGQGRGGIEQAKLFEWGGYEQDGVTYSFPTNRPNMTKPIHQLFVDNGVNIFFQGHDHLFAHEVMGGVTYQEVPMPSDSTYEIGMLANADAYTADTIGGTGHIRVNVSPSCLQIDFVRAWLPADTLSGVHHNGEVAFTYSFGTCPIGVDELDLSSQVKVYPNPVSSQLELALPAEMNQFVVEMFDALGRPVLRSRSQYIDVSKLPEGFYVTTIRSGNIVVNRRVLVSR